uniref:Uncharacterized protein n=1 Tax=Oryza glumipatula TaxID=40148 RepID=A0A0E0A4L9_9ORYZ
MVSSKQWCPSDEKGKDKISSFRFRWPPTRTHTTQATENIYAKTTSKFLKSISPIRRSPRRRTAGGGGSGTACLLLRMEKNKYIGGGYLLSEEEALGGGQLIDEAKEMARKKDLELEAECFVSASTSRMLLVEVFSGELVHMDGELALAVALNNVNYFIIGSGFRGLGNNIASSVS